MSAEPPPPLAELRAISHRFDEAADGPLGRWLVERGWKARAPVVHALDRVDMHVATGEVVGLVGESGCGKSTLGRILAGLLKPTEGEVRMAGQPLAPGASHHRKVQMVFQDPYASLNPRLRIDQAVGEAPRVHGLSSAATLDDYVCSYLERAGLDPALRRRHPHQFSGGQRQRIGIARALAMQPQLLVCDEAVSALDVSIQAQILTLFADLRDQLGLAYLFISHDLGVVRYLADRVVVMYLGQVVESAPAEALFAEPAHPYTQALLAEIPTLSARKRSFHAIRGEMPSPLAPPSGCRFHPRCPHAQERCWQEAPALTEVGTGHWSACHLHNGMAAPRRAGAVTPAEVS